MPDLQQSSAPHRIVCSQYLQSIFQLRLIQRKLCAGHVVRTSTAHVSISVGAALQRSISLHSAPGALPRMYAPYSTTLS